MRRIWLAGRNLPARNSGGKRCVLVYVTWQTPVGLGHVRFFVSCENVNGRKKHLCCVSDVLLYGSSEIFLLHLVQNHWTDFFFCRSRVHLNISVGQNHTQASVYLAIYANYLSNHNTTDAGPGRLSASLLHTGTHSTKTDLVHPSSSFHTLFCHEALFGRLNREQDGRGV